MIAAIIILGVLAAGAIAAIVYLQGRHEAEREQARSAARAERSAARAERQQLLDRIANPQAAALAAFAATVPGPLEDEPPPPDLYTDAVAPSSDLELADLMEERTSDGQ